MADAGIVVGWKDAKAGREKVAMELFQSTMALFGSKVEDGTLQSIEPVIMQRHGGDMNGFILLRGELAKLSAFKSSDAFLDFMTRATFCLDGFGVVEAYLGARLTDVMQRYAKAISGG